jgi:hypothetical protein
MELSYERPESRLCQVPLEIFHYIASFLGPSDQMCLGLTCTGLSHLVSQDGALAFKRNGFYWRKQRRSLLANLAKDSPDMLFCNPCLKLQPLRQGRALTISNQRERRPCRHLAGHVNICQHFSITVEMAELVFRFDRSSGHTSVPPPDLFSHSCTWRTSGRGTSEFELKVQSRIIDRKLYVKASYDVDVRLDPKGKFNTPCTRGKGYLHSGIWLKKRCACAIGHAIKKEEKCIPCSRAQKCAYCVTHFLISAERKSAISLQLQSSVSNSSRDSDVSVYFRCSTRRNLRDCWQQTQTWYVKRSWRSIARNLVP